MVIQTCLILGAGLVVIAQLIKAGEPKKQPIRIKREDPKDLKR